MRLNQFVAQASGISRRAADDAIASQRVTVNGAVATLGQRVAPDDAVYLDNHQLALGSVQTIMFNKPVGYVCSRDGQGAPTIYDLLPKELHHLKPVGRLDKDSSGLLLLTNDGALAYQLTHPSFAKTKLYEISLDKPLDTQARASIEQGVSLDDGLSQLQLEGSGTTWTVRMHEGRNRQIRRTFEALGYKVIRLHRTQFGSYKLNGLGVGEFTESAAS